MNNVVAFMSISLDGFIARPNGELDWHLVDEELHRHFNDQLRTKAAFLSGRRTYELMVDFWPTADEDPNNPPVMAEFAGIWRDKPKIVFSRTLREAGWNTTIRSTVDRDGVDALKHQFSGDLALGGAEVIAAFAADDLVDEYQIYVHPVLIGQGKPLFPPSNHDTALRLAEVRPFSNGVVLMHYQRPGRATSPD